MDDELSVYHLTSFIVSVELVIRSRVRQSWWLLNAVHPPHHNRTLNIDSFRVIGFFLFPQVRPSVNDGHDIVFFSSFSI